MDEITASIESAIREKAWKLLTIRATIEEDKKHLHAYWRGLMDFCGFGPTDSLFRTGCSYINTLAPK